MKKNVDAALRRKAKIEQKSNKQAKVLKILGITLLILVCVIGVCWAVLSYYNMSTRELSNREVESLFKDKSAIPDADHPLIGEWYYYQDDAIQSKYVLTDDGVMEVYNWTKDGYTLLSRGDFRLREIANEMYVKPDNGGTKYILYTYEITKQDGFDIAQWNCAGNIWTLIKLTEE